LAKSGIVVTKLSSLDQRYPTFFFVFRSKILTSVIIVTILISIVNIARAGRYIRKTLNGMDEIIQLYLQIRATNPRHIHFLDKGLILGAYSEFRNQPEQPDCSRIRKRPDFKIESQE
jgi:hypothetical protein